jgi:hypothetical protein
MLSWKLRGDGKHSPFFEARTGQPVVLPRVLSSVEHAEVSRAVGQSR